MDLDEPAAVQFHSDPLTHDLTGEHQVLQDGVMDRGQSAAVELGERKKVINASFPTPFSFSVSTASFRASVQFGSYWLKALGST